MALGANINSLGFIYNSILSHHRGEDVSGLDINQVYISDLINLTPDYPFYSDGIRRIAYDGEVFLLFCDIEYYLNNISSILSPGYVIDIIICSNEKGLSGDFNYYPDVLCSYRIIFQIDMSSFKLKRNSSLSNLCNYSFSNNISYGISSTHAYHFDFLNLKESNICISFDNIDLTYIISGQSDLSNLDYYVNDFKSYILENNSKNMRFKRHLNPMHTNNYLINLCFVDMDKEFSKRYLEEFLCKLEVSCKSFKRRGLNICLAHGIDGYNRSSKLFNSVVCRDNLNVW